MTHHLNFLFGLERKLADAVFAAGRMTPAGFRYAAKEVLPSEIYDKWAEQLPSAHYRGWKGLEEAARNLHYQASRIFHGDAEAIRAAEDAANAIYGLIPLIKGPRKRPRALHDREWDSLAFCKLCWRLAPSGKATSRRPAYCARHQPRTPEYQRARRLKYDLETVPRGYSSSKKYTRHFAVRSEYTDTFIRIRGQMRGAGSFPELVARLPCLQAEYKDFLRDAATLLSALLLDVPDPHGKIAAAIPALASDLEEIAGVLLHAEAWLSLQASHPHGGKRARQGGGPEKESSRQHGTNKGTTRSG